LAHWWQSGHIGNNLGTLATGTLVAVLGTLVARSGILVAKVGTLVAPRETHWSQKWAHWRKFGHIGNILVFTQ